MLTILRARSLRMVGVLLLLWLGLALHPETREAFLTATNFSNLTAQIAEIVIIGVGMTLVILIGGIDLSVGAGIALTGVVAAKLQLEHHAAGVGRLPGRAGRRRHRRPVARPPRHARRHAAVRRHARRLSRLSRHRRSCSRTRAACRR